MFPAPMDLPPTPAPISPVAPPAPPALPAGGPNPSFGSRHALSLLHGWLPPTIELIALAVLIVAVARGTRRWWLFRVPICVLLGIGTAVAAWSYMNDQGLSSDPAPPQLWVCIGATGVALAVAVAGWPGARWWRRTAAIAAVPLAAASSVVVLDQWVGYYPTVQSAWSALTAGPLPHQTDLDALAGMRNTRPPTGVVVPVTTPDSASGFNHRTEYVYLPPAWFDGNTPPALPTVMMVGGEFNTPGDWLRSGRIMPTIDRFTAAAGGRSPILVFVDSSGSFNNDTECVDGTRGAAADHLTEDVVPYVDATFGTSRDPASRAVVGWSMGGTCAVDLTVMHPELFRTFVDIAGDLGPTAGTKDQTIRRLYGGDAAQWDRFDPLTVMAKHGPYSGVAGLFDDLTPGQRPGPPAPVRPPVDDDTAGLHGRDGGADPGEVGAAEQLCARGEDVGIDCTVHTTSGGHTWQFAAAAYTSAFPWVAARVGLPTTG